MSNRMHPSIKRELLDRARSWQGADCLVGTYVIDMHTLVTVFNNNATEWNVLRTFMMQGRAQVSCDLTTTNVNDVFKQLETAING